MPPAKKKPATGAATPKKAPKAAAAPLAASPAAATPTGKLADKIKDKQAGDGHRNAEKEKHTDANIMAAKGAKHKAYLAEGTTKSMSADANIQASSHYVDLAKEYETRALAEQAHEHDDETLLSRFGAAIAEKLPSGTLNEKASIVWEWDVNKDGKLSKVEFRMQVKGLGVGEDDVRKIDELFKSFDTDNSDTLDLKELKVAFKRAVIEANKVRGARTDVLERVANLRKLAEHATQVAEKTTELEEEEAALVAMRDAQGVSLEEKLGQRIAKQGTKIGDVKGFDTDGDGTVDKKEFRALVRSMEIKDLADEALDELYNSLDKDQSGSLELGEIKETLKRLQAAAATATGNLTDEAQLVAEMVKVVGSSQRRFEAQRQAAELLLSSPVDVQ